MEALHSKYPAKWPKPGSDGPPPGGMIDRLESAMEDMMKNGGVEKTPNNMDGCPWEVEKKLPWLVVSSSKAKGHSSRRFRVEMELAAPSPHMVYEQMLHWPHRLEWDTANLSWARVLRAYAGRTDKEHVNVEIYTSMPAAGGMISPRIFTDGRLTRFVSDDEIHSTAAEIHPKLAYYKEVGLSELDKYIQNTKLVRGHVFAGSGVTVRRDGEKVRATMLCHSDIGGWLPTSVVNSATATALMDIATALKKRVEKVTASVGSIPAPIANAKEGERRKIRIRPPNCTDHTRYSWRWEAVPRA